MHTCKTCGKEKSPNGEMCRSCMFKSPEYRKKQRQTALRTNAGARIPSPKGNKWNVGRKHTDATKKKHSEISKRLGLKPPVHYGKDNPRWNGGITPLRVKLWKTFEYRQWRSDIFQRDDWTCQDCNEKGGELNAHHLKPISLILTENNITTVEQALNCEELWNINNGLTLCKKCHKKTDSYLKKVN